MPDQCATPWQLTVWGGALSGVLGRSALTSVTCGSGKESTSAASAPPTLARPQVSLAGPAEGSSMERSSFMIAAAP